MVLFFIATSLTLDWADQCDYRKMNQHPIPQLMMKVSLARRQLISCLASVEDSLVCKLWQAVPSAPTTAYKKSTRKLARSAFRS